MTTQHYETDPCGCIYVVGGGDFVGDPDGKVLSKPCEEHNKRTEEGMSNCRICGSDKPLVCDLCLIVELEDARKEALEDAVKAIEEKQVERTLDKKLNDFQDGYALGIRAAAGAVKDLGADHG